MTLKGGTFVYVDTSDCCISLAVLRQATKTHDRIDSFKIEN
jgi:hypothetical protein